MQIFLSKNPNIYEKTGNYCGLVTSIKKLGPQTFIQQKKQNTTRDTRPHGGLFCGAVKFGLRRPHQRV